MNLCDKVIGKLSAKFIENKKYFFKVIIDRIIYKKFLRIIKENVNLKTI